MRVLLMLLVVACVATVIAAIVRVRWRARFLAQTEQKRRIERELALIHGETDLMELQEQYAVTHEAMIDKAKRKERREDVEHRDAGSDRGDG
jgi:hypothetical protein